MKTTLRAHIDSIADICPDDITMKEFIQSKINTNLRDDKDDPFFVCDISDIFKKWCKFSQWLPRVEPFYAIKCNPDPVVVSLLAKLGVNFDCASKSEIQQVLDSGVTPDRIVFANPCKQTSHIKFAAKHKVQMMTFDNEPELHKMKTHYPNAEAIIRVRVDDSMSACKLGIKFGASATQVPHLLQVARNLNVNVIGVSFHVGSGCYNATQFYDAVKLASSVFKQACEAGFSFHLLDVGGGFPGTDIEDITFEDTAKEVNRGLNEFFPPSSGIRIIAEPGRFFVASAFSSVCNVTSMRKVTNVEEKKKESYMYYLNDGVYGSFNCILFDHQHPIPYVLHNNDEETYVKYACSIWGPTCDSMDCITNLAYLPKVNIGDWICFDNMGAYTYAAGSRFNGFKMKNIYFMCRQLAWEQIEMHFSSPALAKKLPLIKMETLAIAGEQRC